MIMAIKTDVLHTFGVQVVLKGLGFEEFGHLEFTEFIRHLAQKKKHVANTYVGMHACMCMYIDSICTYTYHV